MIIAVSGASTSTLLSRLAKKISRSAQEEELGMRPRHFWVLSFLSDHDGVPQHELGDAFMLDANNAVLLLNELDAAGYIERRRNPQDRRRHLVFLTSAGREALGGPATHTPPQRTRSSAGFLSGSVRRCGPC